jgi:hypothetical protein
MQADAAAAAAAAEGPPAEKAVVLQEDLCLPGAATPAPAAAPLLSVLQGALADQLLQVWEFACCFGPLLGLAQVPSLAQLERGLLGTVSHTGTMASAFLQEAAAAAQAAGGGGDTAAGGDGAAAAAAAAPAAAGGALAAAAAAASRTQVEYDAAAGAAWVQLHMAILDVLVQDAFTAVTNVVFGAEQLKAAAQREVRAGMPLVDGTTWPETARRLLAATATATFLAQVRPRVCVCVCARARGVCVLRVARPAAAHAHTVRCAGLDSHRCHTVCDPAARRRHARPHRRVSQRAARRAAAPRSWTCRGSCAAWRRRTGRSTCAAGSTCPTSSAAWRCCRRAAARRLPSRC